MITTSIQSGTPVNPDPAAHIQEALHNWQARHDETQKMLAHNINDGQLHLMLYNYKALCEQVCQEYERALTVLRGASNDKA